MGENGKEKNGNGMISRNKYNFFLHRRFLEGFPSIGAMLKIFYPFEFVVLNAFKIFSIYRRLVKICLFAGGFRKASPSMDNLFYWSFIDWLKENYICRSSATFFLFLGKLWKDLCFWKTCKTSSPSTKSSHKRNLAKCILPMKETSQRYPFQGWLAKKNLLSMAHCQNFELRTSVKVLI